MYRPVFLRRRIDIGDSAANSVAWGKKAPVYLRTMGSIDVSTVVLAAKKTYKAEVGLGFKTRLVPALPNQQQRIFIREHRLNCNGLEKEENSITQMHNEHKRDTWRRLFLIGTAPVYNFLPSFLGNVIAMVVKVGNGSAILYSGSCATTFHVIAIATTIVYSAESGENRLRIGSILTVPIPKAILARAEALLRYYIRNHKGRQRHALLRQRAAARARRANALPRAPIDFGVDFGVLSSDSDTPSSNTSSTDADTTASDSGSEWSDILGPNWRFMGDMLVDGEFSITDLDDTVDSSSSSSGRDMPDLFSVSSDSSDSGSSELDWDWSSGAEGDDEESEDSSDDSDDMNRRPRLRGWLREEVEAMYKQCYEEPHDNLPRGPSHLYHTLTALKATRADHFRQQLHVSPVTFDKLVATLELGPVFFNNSNRPQLPVDQQVAGALYRFGHDGNAASIQAVANWAT
ncbi:hypothetical protein DFH08DRAFT_984071 [Mycena albidolilacea]|uniref:Uncharacterized protein n=1 Tax=Mycena albidolilacea TaxID=1033008 RepID=A0AAD7F593_9AGAR|nr:hypothetical protein DFH08DRAFT_984071 [Mycena albidolilacea]